MKIDTMMVGPIMTNCYLLQDEKAGVCALIDPGDDAKQVETMVDNSGCTLQYILLTHGHFDHCSAVRPLLEKYDVKSGFWWMISSSSGVTAAIRSRSCPGAQSLGNAPKQMGSRAI